MVQSADIEERILILKLRRIEQLNEKLRESLKRDRIPASRAATLIIELAQETPDPLVPSSWPLQSELNRYRVHNQLLSMQQKTECCTIM